MSSAVRISFAAGRLAAGLWLGAVSTAWAADDLGVVISLHGKPSAIASGGDRPIKVLQALEKGERVRVGRADGLVVCLSALESGFSIEGPGTVSLTPVGITAVDGTPSVVSTGRCEDSAAADSNGGVILRGFGLRRKIRSDAAQQP